MHFKKYFLTYTLVPLTLLFLAASFYRFMVSYDYLVSYEGFCDPYTESCFLYCEDGACTEPFYSTFVERRAYTLRELCGNTILDCAAADTCLPDEPDCSVTYCNPRRDDDCETLTRSDMPTVDESETDAENTSSENISTPPHMPPSDDTSESPL